MGARFEPQSVEPLDEGDQENEFWHLVSGNNEILAHSEMLTNAERGIEDAIRAFRQATEAWEAEHGPVI